MMSLTSAYYKNIKEKKIIVFSKVPDNIIAKTVLG